MSKTNAGDRSAHLTKLVHGHPSRRNIRNRRWSSKSLKSGVEYLEHRLMFATLPSPSFDSVDTVPIESRSLRAPEIDDATPMPSQFVRSVSPPRLDIKLSSDTVSLVAILDTGVEFGSPSIRDAVFQNHGEIPENQIDDDGNGYIDDSAGFDFLNRDHAPQDEHGHGTIVSALVAATARAVAPNQGGVEILPLKVADREGRVDLAAAAEAIDYAISTGADLIVTAFGTEQNDPAFAAALQRASDAGIAVVVPAGNDAMSIDHTAMYPASYHIPGLINVGAIEEVGGAVVHADYTNYGTNVMSFAPGSAVAISADGVMQEVHGTSFAAARFAGWMAARRSMAKPHAPLDSATSVVIRTSLLDAPGTGTVIVLPSHQNLTVAGQLKGNIFDDIGDAIDDALGDISDVVGDVAGELTDVVEEVWGGAVDALQGAVEMIRDPVGTVEGWIDLAKAVAHNPLRTGEQIVSQLFHDVTKNPLHAIGSTVTNFALASLSDAIWEQIPDLPKGQGSLVAQAREAATAAGRHFEEFVDFFVGALHSSIVPTELQEVFDWMIDLGPRGVDLGCGIADFGLWIVPDQILGLDLSKACASHDSDFDLTTPVGETIAENFAENMQSNGQFLVDILAAGYESLEKRDLIAAAISPVVAVIYSSAVTAVAIVSASAETIASPFTDAQTSSAILLFGQQIVKAGQRAGDRQFAAALPQTPDRVPALQYEPAAPSNLAVGDVGKKQVRLSWKDNSANERSFVIQRSQDGGRTWTDQENVAPSLESAKVTGLKPNRTYHFRVIAKNPYGISAASNVVEVSTNAKRGSDVPPARPSGPTTLRRPTKPTAPPKAVMLQAPQNIRIDGKRGYVTIQWANPNPDADLLRVAIRRKGTSDWTKAAVVAAGDGNQRIKRLAAGEYEFQLRFQSGNGATREYSPYSPIIAVRVTRR